MVEFTDRAREMVLSYMDRSQGERQALRIELENGSPLSPRYELTLVSEEERRPDDVVVDVGDIRVVMPASSADRLRGATVDYVERVNEAGFEVRPATVEAELATAEGREPPEGPLAERVRELLDEQVNPAIASHGGYIGLVDVEGTEIYVQMSGGCQGCAMSRLTLRQGVERMIRQSIPEVTAVHDVTDHASGENPYYSGM